jgi:hypothetical protein
VQPAKKGATANFSPISTRREKESPSLVKFNSLKGPIVFEQFWAAYPARKSRPKVGKAVCLALFAQYDDETQALIVQAAKAYAKASKPRDGEFVPDPRDPERFLKKDWWRDWLDVPAQQCQFRSMTSCEQLAIEGSDVCEFHAAYRAKLARAQARRG